MKLILCTCKKKEKIKKNVVPLWNIFLISGELLGLREGIKHVRSTIIRCGRSITFDRSRFFRNSRGFENSIFEFFVQTSNFRGYYLFFEYSEKGEDFLRFDFLIPSLVTWLSY